MNLFTKHGTASLLGQASLPAVAPEHARGKAQACHVLGKARPAPKPVVEAEGGSRAHCGFAQCLKLFSNFWIWQNQNHILPRLSLLIFKPMHIFSEI